RALSLQPPGVGVIPSRGAVEHRAAAHIEALLAEEALIENVEIVDALLMTVDARLHARRVARRTTLDTLAKGRAGRIRLAREIRVCAVARLRARNASLARSVGRLARTGSGRRRRPRRPGRIHRTGRADAGSTLGRTGNLVGRRHVVA